MNVRKDAIYSTLSIILFNGSRWFYNSFAARFLTASDFSLFSFVLTSSNLVLPLFTFGVNLGLIREVPILLKKGKGEILYIEQMFWGYIILISIAAFIFSLILSKFTKIGFSTFAIVITVSLVLSILVFIQSILKAFSLFLEEFKISLTFSFFMLAVIVLWFVSGTYCFEYAILFFLIPMLIATGYGIRKASHIQLFSFKPNFKVKPFVSNYLKYGSHEILVAIYTNSVSFLSFFILTSTEYAIFRKILLVSIPFTMISGSISQVFLNKFSVIYVTDRSSLKKFFRKTQKLYLLAGIIGYVIAICIFFPVSSLIKLEKQYLLLYSILSLSILFRFISSLYGIFLTTIGFQTLRVITVMIAALSSIFLLLILTPSLGLWGVVISYISSFFVILTIYFYFGELKVLRGSK
ncbi:lipopolysaccharide biosynthesis protein [Phorcysia thermohydrogeniphila]|uniref:O-antigen/teichoic acid export membrane protein n=1 Tax=Phorcysia thermohydrogeniphila TaxID=936138 RepID=A0A4R1GCJ7_9BACT|nr:hypothetical protein [Phorcysia thermohydrogeniphila]TCK04450.1 hypothetical protein CLV27_0875 [Phorcysia thermohydrogeniphila]